MRGHGSRRTLSEGKGKGRWGWVWGGGEGGGGSASVEILGYGMPGRREGREGFREFRRHWKNKRLRARLMTHLDREYILFEKFKIFVWTLGFIETS